MKRMNVIGIGAFTLAVGLLGSGPLLAVENVEILGLFSGKAVLRIDGKRRVLAAGESSPEGVKLISADSSAATLEIDGHRERKGLGTQIGGSYNAPPSQSVQLWQDRDQMFRTVGSINGLTVNFLLDTGATMVIMNANEARRLGIDFRMDGQPATVQTASGHAPAYRVTLGSVQVGDIRLRDVDGVVIDGAAPNEVLLGMSFLSRLEMHRKGKMLVLEQKQ